MLGSSYQKASDACVLTQEKFESLFIAPVHNSEQYGLNVHTLLSQWEDDPASAPTMRRIMEMAGHAFGMSEQSEALEIAKKAGDLGHELEEDGFPQGIKKEFHCAPDHPRKVLLQTIRLMATHDQISPESEKFSQDEILMMMAIAATHDVGHDGKGNGFGESHTQFKLEEKAFQEFSRHFYAVYSDQKLEQIHTIFLCTDPSSVDGPLTPKSPMMLMRDYARGDIKQNDLPLELKGITDKRTLLMAKIINIADLATSAGLCADRTRKESLLLSLETGIAEIATDIKSALFIKIVGITDLFALAQSVYGENPHNIIKQMGMESGFKLEP